MRSAAMKKSALSLGASALIFCGIGVFGGSLAGCDAVLERQTVRFTENYAAWSPRWMASRLTTAA
jgi:hypothetical protein